MYRKTADEIMELNPEIAIIPWVRWSSTVRTCR